MASASDRVNPSPRRRRRATITLIDGLKQEKYAKHQYPWKINAKKSRPFPKSTVGDASSHMGAMKPRSGGESQNAAEYRATAPTNAPSSTLNSLFPPYTREAAALPITSATSATAARTSPFIYCIHFWKSVT